MSTEPSDHELVRRSLAGEQRAFAQLVEKHQRLVYGVALSGAHDVAQAEDVAQEAFVEAWRDLPRLRDPSRVGSWIAGIARNLARTWARHTARRRQRETAAIAAPAEAVPTPHDRVVEGETQSLVRDALEDMPDAYREVLVLYYVHGRSVADVATGLGISEDLVKQRLSRGRRALRASLETRVEDALTQLGPSKGFTTLVMATVSTLGAREAAAATTAGTAGKVWLGMKATNVAMIGTALVVAGGVGFYGLSSGASDPKPSIDQPTPVATTSDRPRDQRQTSVNIRKLPSKEAREQLLQTIRSARQQAAQSPRGARPTSSAPANPAPATINNDSPDADKEYVRSAVKGLLPLLVDCYKTALEDEPTLGGRLVVNFTIEGEADVGGLVTESAIDADQSEIKNAEMNRCVQETMFALEIDPPTSGSVQVTYPFEFRTAEK
jgi:RNA polymerase sigma factor (sigma-70 family)